MEDNSLENNTRTLDDNLYADKINQRPEIRRSKQIHEMTLSDLYYEWSKATKGMITDFVELLQYGRLQTVINEQIQERKQKKQRNLLYFDSFLHPEQLQIVSEDNLSETIRKYIMSIVFICIRKERYIWSGVTIMILGIFFAFLFRL